MGAVVTYLEMTSPGELRPGRVAAEVALRQVGRDSPLIPDVQRRIGAPHGWVSATRSAREWAQWLAHPRREYHLLVRQEQILGIVDLEPQPAGDVEITAFGLLPEHVGAGVGGYALTLAVHRAWQVEPADTTPVSRVWLHTSSEDHPHALRNYLSRGFRIFRTEERPASSQS